MGEEGQKISGIDIIIMAEIGGEWKPVGGQRGATLNESRDAVDTTSKTSPGQWTEKSYGKGEWSVSCDGVYLKGDDSYRYMRNALRNRTEVKVRWKEEDDTMFEGFVLVTTCNQEGPYDGEPTYSMELEGSGQPSEYDGEFSNNLSALEFIEEEAGASLSIIPTFDAETYTYLATAVTTSTYVKVTPTAAQGVITVNGAVVSSGNQTGEVALGAAGTLTDVTIKVTETGKLPRTYKVTVAREAS